MSRLSVERTVANEIKKLEAELREWGALPSKRSLPEKLISGTFHEALEAYAEEIRTTAKRPGTDVLTPYGRLRLKHVTRLKRQQPWYNEGSTNAQATFANVWVRLLGRVRKSHPDFRSLPFGSLRDTLPDLMRHRFDDELASLCLAHGTPFRQDNLLECYGNKPFGRLHKALREMEAVMTPVFRAAPADPTEERKTYLPIATLDRIKAMLGEGKRPSEIAKECGVSTMTVYREQKVFNDRAGSGSG